MIKYLITLAIIIAIAIASLNVAASLMGAVTVAM